MAAVAGLVSLILLGIGVFADGRVTAADVRAVGVAGALASLTWFFVSRARHSETAIFDVGKAVGFDEGYDEGYHDGRRVARPVVLIDGVYRSPAASSDA